MFLPERHSSSWLFTLMFFTTVNKHLPLALICKVLKNPVWCGLLVEFLVGIKRTWDRKLSSGLLFTFMANHLFQFRFADAEQYWLITWTFFRSQQILRPVFSQRHKERH